MFITYGDTFLATTNSYDELYYELNREEKVFSEIHAMGKFFLPTAKVLSNVKTNNKLEGEVSFDLHCFNASKMSKSEFEMEKRDFLKEIKNLRENITRSFMKINKRGGYIHFF